MANIKFSQFTVGNTESDIDFVVGYKGANNIQISPANLLSATLSGYLPLAGGTMTGTSGIHMPDNFALKAGNSQDLRIFHDGSGSKVENYTGNLTIQQRADDSDIVLQCDDGSGGITDYLRLDGSNPTVVFSKSSIYTDNIKAYFGTGLDLEIFHNATHSFITNANGDLTIANYSDDRSIYFQNDDGSGGSTNYMQIDGANEVNKFHKHAQFLDSIEAKFGNGGDLRIYHDGSNSYVQADGTGDLIIKQNADDQDIKFMCDDGSGGTEIYINVDGSARATKFVNATFHNDNVQGKFGNAGDMLIYHNGTNNLIDSVSGDISIRQLANDKDIRFRCDDGSGGETEYFRLDGGLEKMVSSKNMMWLDNIKAQFGDSNDLSIRHDSSNSIIENSTGDLRFTNKADDKDIVFQSDDGSGAVTTYFFLDGSSVTTQFYKTIKLYDAAFLYIGDSNDLQFYHNGTSNIDNYTGNLDIIQRHNDGDIRFYNDDGSGGTTEYFRLDGSLATGSRVYTVFPDNSTAVFGSGFDFQIHHDASNTYVQQGGTGDLYFQQNVDDRDIIFQSDNGSGGVVTYFFLDGSQVALRMKRKTKWDDNIEATFGDGEDLVIKHNGTNNVIQSITGDLKVGVANTFAVQNDTFDENMITAAENGEVSLFHNGDKKLDTRTTGIRITGISEYADNTAAIAGGLTTGDVYRTGDLLKIVH